MWEIGRRGGKVGFTLASKIVERSIILASGAVFSEFVGIFLIIEGPHLMPPSKSTGLEGTSRLVPKAIIWFS